MTAATDEARAQTDAPQINRILNTWAVARNVRFTDVDMAYLRNYLLAMLREARDDGARDMRETAAELCDRCDLNSNEFNAGEIRAIPLPSET